MTFMGGLVVCSCVSLACAQPSCVSCRCQELTLHPSSVCCLLGGNVMLVVNHGTQTLCLFSGRI